MSIYYNRYYITTDSQGCITAGWSDGPHRDRDTSAAICICAEGGYQFRLTPMGEENPPLYTMDGLPLYRWDGEAVIQRTEAEIAALNSGEKRYSDYMRPGFEFLQELIDRGYIDAQKAYVSEAIEGEGADFLAQKTPIVMAYWSAANTDTAYGDPDFNMVVIGFPSSRGQMPVMSMTGFSIGVGSEHAQDAMETLDIILSDEALETYTSVNKVISSSKNVQGECIPALKPLNDKIQQDTYVLATNASMKVEQWGNTCLIVRKLMEGASVDACMAEFDRLQEEALKNDN